MCKVKRDGSKQPTRKVCLVRRAETCLRKKEAAMDELGMNILSRGQSAPGLRWTWAQAYECAGSQRGWTSSVLVLVLERELETWNRTYYSAFSVGEMIMWPWRK